MEGDRQEFERLILNIDLGETVAEEELDEVTRQLRSELMELDVDAVEFVRSGELPEGAKSAEAVTLGSLAVILLPTFIPKLLEYLQSWSLRAENRKVSVKTQIGDRSIELEYTPAAMSQDELQRLVQTLTDVLIAKPGSDLAE
jgi:hypothetical protein